MDLDLTPDCEFSIQTCDQYLYANNDHGQYQLSQPPDLAAMLNDSVAGLDLDNEAILSIPLDNYLLTVSQGTRTDDYQVGDYSLASVETSRQAVSSDSYYPQTQGNFYNSVDDFQPFQTLASIDNNAPITISVNDISVDEGSGFAEFEISLSRAPGNDSVEFEFQTLDETAVNGQDYITTSDIISLTGPAITTRISVAIVDDFDVEGPETFTFEISNVIGAVIARSTGLATINDNDQDAPVNVLTISDVAVDENQEEAIIKFSLSQPPGQFPVEFNFSTVSGTAVEGEDFTAKSGLRSFTGNETEKFVRIPIIDDDAIEPDETLYVEITDLFGVSLINSTANITIRDDDTPTINYLTVDAVTVDESAGVAVIKFSLSEAPGEDEIEFNFSTLNGNAIDGIDFSGESGFRTMTGNETNSFVSIPIFDDDESEGLETFDVEITNLVGAEIENPIVTSSIIDNDQITNTLTISDVSVDEKAGAVVFKFSLEQAPGENQVEFNFATADDTALDGQDYTGVSGYRTMQGPTRDMYLSIPILDDNNTEPDESFILSVTNVKGAVFNGTTARAIIEDDD